MTAAFAFVSTVVPLSLVALWLVSVVWVHHDARLRIRNGRAAVLAALGAALLPLAGAAAWALVRPAETLDERRRRRLARLLVELEAGPGSSEGDSGPARRQPGRLAVV